MSESQSSGRPLLSNYDCVREPRDLTHEEVETGHEQDGDNTTTAYYAIMREDGYVGKNIGANTRSPKIRILYVSEDATWSFTRMHRAREVNEGSDPHAFAGSWPAVIKTDPESGQRTSKRSLAQFRQLAADLHDDYPHTEVTA